MNDNFDKCCDFVVKLDRGTAHVTIQMTLEDLRYGV